VSIQHDDQTHGEQCCCRRNGRRFKPWIRSEEVWQHEDMHNALAVRDIATVYRLLQRYGASQRAIGERTGQSQSEISEILSGRRVTSYDVLVRIADGLGVPRDRMGLAGSLTQPELDT
jgi:antitoxin component HigA of HigAB toxin-antitoxin module